VKLTVIFDTFNIGCPQLLWKQNKTSPNFIADFGPFLKCGRVRMLGYCKYSAHTIFIKFAKLNKNHIDKNILKNEETLAFSFQVTGV